MPVLYPPDSPVLCTKTSFECLPFQDAFVLDRAQFLGFWQITLFNFWQITRAARHKTRHKASRVANRRVREEEADVHAWASKYFPAWKYFIFWLKNTFVSRMVLSSIHTNTFHVHERANIFQHGNTFVSRMIKFCFQSTQIHVIFMREQASTFRHGNNFVSWIFGIHTNTD